MMMMTGLASEVGVCLYVGVCQEDKRVHGCCANVGTRGYLLQAGAASWIWRLAYTLVINYWEYVWVWRLVDVECVQTLTLSEITVLVSINFSHWLLLKGQEVLCLYDSPLLGGIAFHKSQALIMLNIKLDYVICLYLVWIRIKHC